MTPSLAVLLMPLHERGRRPKEALAMSSAAAETHEHATIFDHAAYWLPVIGVYFLVSVLFFHSGK
jgi:hypothetical protein